MNNNHVQNLLETTQNVYQKIEKNCSLLCDNFYKGFRKKLDEILGIFSMSLLYSLKIPVEIEDKHDLSRGLTFLKEMVDLIFALGALIKDINPKSPSSRFQDTPENNLEYASETIKKLTTSTRTEMNALLEITRAIILFVVDEDHLTKNFNAEEMRSRVEGLVEEIETMIQIIASDEIKTLISKPPRIEKRFEDRAEDLRESAIQLEYEGRRFLSEKKLGIAEEVLRDFLVAHQIDPEENELFSLLTEIKKGEKKDRDAIQKDLRRIFSQEKNAALTNGQKNELAKFFFLAHEEQYNKTMLERLFDAYTEARKEEESDKIPTVPSEKILARLETSFGFGNCKKKT